MKYDRKENTIVLPSKGKYFLKPFSYVCIYVGSCRVKCVYVFLSVVPSPKKLKNAGSGKLLSWRNLNS